MSDDPVKRFLRARGYADHVVDGGIEGLVASWESIADAIEAGYGLDWFSYLNDLDVRQAIEVVLSSMPSDDGSLLDRLRDADTRVRASTVPAGRCVSGHDAVSERRNWWYFVIPANPGPELADDLVAEGLRQPPEV